MATRSKRTAEDLGIPEDVMAQVAEHFVLIPRERIDTTCRVSAPKANRDEVEVFITFDLTDATAQQVLDLMRGKAVVEAQNRFLRPVHELSGVEHRSHHSYRLGELVGTRKGDPRAKARASMAKLSPAMRREVALAELAALEEAEAEEAEVDSSN